jgi:hypothetical protein
MKHIHNKTILNFEGKVMPVKGDTDDIPFSAIHHSTASAIRLLISAVPTKTYAEIENSLTLMGLAKEAGQENLEVIAIENADHAYLMTQLEEFGPVVFRLNTLNVKAMFEDEVEGVKAPEPSSNGVDAETEAIPVAAK